MGSLRRFLLLLVPKKPQQTWLIHVVLLAIQFGQRQRQFPGITRGFMVWNVTRFISTVLSWMLNHLPEGARCATTLIKAKFTVGNGERVNVISLAQLKKDNPNQSAEEQPPPRVDAPAAFAQESTAASLENPEQSSNNLASPGTADNASGVVAAAEPAPAAKPGSVQSTRSGTTQITASTASTGASQVPIVTCHGTEWFDRDTSLPTNGPFTRRTWKMTCQYTSKEYTPLCDDRKEIPTMEYFMTMFPEKQLTMMVEETSKALVKEGSPKTTKGEMLKWFGILLLITRFEFGDRATLWQTKSHCKYIPAPSFGVLE
jgi:Transposase IS4